MNAKQRRALRRRSERKVAEWREELLQLRICNRNTLTAPELLKLEVYPGRIRAHEEIIKAHANT